MSQVPRYFLLGPTASGKTAVSLALARHLDAEILSLDSMLVYRGMDIGTAKPSGEEQGTVPHHLIDLVDPSEEFSVKRYLEAASEVEATLAAKGRSALYVGGTTMWFKALMFGLLEVPEASEEVRQSLQQRLQAPGGAEVLRAELAEVDPAAYGPAGTFIIPSGPCAGLSIDIGAPTLAGFFTANASGDLSISTTLPAGACGLTVQAVDMATCTKSNSITLRSPD